MTENPTPDPTADTGERLTRRRTLTRLGGLVAASFGAAGLEAALSRPAEGARTGLAAVAAGLVTCVLTPEQTEGPYYVDTEKVRRDIREGKPGLAMLLRTTVVDASTCKPIKGAAVDVWHCDAGGAYSGVDGDTGTFLRGIQRSDARGLTTFLTIFPGWYPGRTTHVHVKVHLGGNVVHTGQIYFPESAVATAAKRSPYRLRGEPDTRNAADAIYRNGGSKSLARMSRDSSGRLVAALTTGVQRR
jgi:protocatechuate 3,4-dioxygenase beta subunit